MPSYQTALFKLRRERDSNPWNAMRSTVFETAPIDHSGISPKPFTKQKQPFRVAFPAETEGFEPPIHFCITVFKTAAIDRSAISPLQKYKSFQCCNIFLQNFLFSRKNPLSLFPIMKLFIRNIALITLFFMALYFSACNKKSIPTEIMDFKNNYENSDEYLHKLSKLADSCTKFHASDPIFLEKKSNIFFQKGRNEHKKGDYLNATTSLIEAFNSQKAVISLKKECDNDDYHYLGQILENIGDIYSDVNGIKPASYFYDHALSEFENASRHHEVIDILLKIGDLYQQNHITNIALLNYEIAEEKKNLTEKQNDLIQIKKGIALYDVFDIASADSIYGRISKKSPQFIEYHYFEAYHFYFANKYEEALSPLQKCFDEGDMKMKVASAEMLASIYFSLNNHDKELFFAQYQAKAQSAEARLTPVKMELESVYESFINSNDPQKASKTKGFNGLSHVLIIIIVILIIIATATVFTLKNKNEKQDISEPVTIPDNNTHSFDDNFKAFASTKIYKEIKTSLEGKEIFIKTVSDYPRLALTKVEIVSLTMKFNESFPNLTHTLLETYPNLTTADIRFIILNLMGFSDIEIAVLLKQTYSSANKRSNRIKDILHTEEELEHFIPNFLRSLKYQKQHSANN